MRTRHLVRPTIAICTLLAGAAHAQTFRITAGGGNTFGPAPAACSYSVAQSQPQFDSSACSTSQRSWSGSAGADRGAVCGSTAVDYHELGLWTLGTEYNVSGEISANDLVVSGPAAGSVPVTMKFDIVFSSAVDPGGWGQAGASASVMGWLGGLVYNNQNFTTNGVQHASGGYSLPPNVPNFVELYGVAGARAAGPADNGIPHASAELSVHFVIGEPAFIVPPGYSVDSPALNIVNNYWLGPVQSAMPSMAYGTAKVNSLGCAPKIGSSGSASASGAAPFLVTASNVLNGKLGLMFYGMAPANLPFQGGTKLVADPVVRTPVQTSGGNPSPPDDCSGQYSYDMNARIQSGVDANLVSGARVYCQYWSRDPASPSTTGLSDALSFLIAP